MANNFSNSIKQTTPIVLNLIIINAIVFLIQFFFDGSQEAVTTKIALWPFDSGMFRPYQIVTHMFAHGGLTHILFNMFALWSFGSLLEKVWGPKRFLTFYLLCGLAAAAAQLLFSNVPAVGASGAIMGLFAAFAYLFPNMQLIIFPIPLPIKAKYAVALMAAVDLFGGIVPSHGGNIAHFAHLGGLVMGFILVLYWNKTGKKNFY